MSSLLSHKMATHEKTVFYFNFILRHKVYIKYPNIHYINIAISNYFTVEIKQFIELNY